MSLSKMSATNAAYALIVSALLMSFGCTNDPASSPKIGNSLAAKVTSGNPTVTSTDPDSASPSVTLDVRVLGSGYDRGSRATWALNGDTTFATTKIKTNSMRYVSATEIVANITISADAALASYDIEVTTSSGKHGVGIELFTIVPYHGNGGPFTAMLDDALSNKLRSDDGTSYADGLRCVYSQWESGGGFYQLRTISNTTECKAVQRPGWRNFTLDLGATNSFDLDQDGIAESIENVPARLIFADAFAQAATTTPVRLLILVVNPDGSTTQASNWSLEYRDGATVTGAPIDGRILTTVNGTADVVYTTSVHGKLVSTYKGTVQVPFKLTLGR
jgi:hypothetical protein